MDNTSRVVLNSGDIVIDPDYHESGLLVMRFDVMAAFNHVSADPVWAWDILWSGSRSVRPSGTNSVWLYSTGTVDRTTWKFSSRLCAMQRPTVRALRKNLTLSFW